jgi:predicted O-linked N-acetylglucosamine transferase (SPINDLY family)
MNAIDYRFTDALADSPQSQRFYTEELFFLPAGFLCYKPADFAPPVASLPASRNGYITFGSFNSSSKIHPQIIELWAQILKANVNSRMVLKLGISLDRQMSSNYFRQFERFGINPDRVAVCGWKTIDEHLKLYGEVDIALDTYPCNGYTTTCEALWMGVPIISRLGRCHASRVGLSILSSIGLDCFAASSPEDYVARATALAANRQALGRLRTSMRQRMAASALCDAGGFTRRVEAAYRKMWRRWCQTRIAGAPAKKQILPQR